MILHSRFAVPAGANFKLSDIKVNGVPLKWGLQIAKTFFVQLAGGGISPQPKKKLQKCPPVGTRKPMLPNVQYVLDYNLLLASINNNLNTLSNITSCITQVEVNSTTDNIAILTNNAQETTQFEFGTGIKVTVKDYNNNNNNLQIFLVAITVDANVEIGEKPLTLFNNPSDPRYPISGILEVVPKGSLPKNPPKNIKAPSTSLLKEEEIQHLTSILK